LIIVSKSAVSLQLASSLSSPISAMSAFNLLAACYYTCFKGAGHDVRHGVVSTELVVSRVGPHAINEQMPHFAPYEVEVGSHHDIPRPTNHTKS
jgi:predicted small secreted protein